MANYGVESHTFRRKFRFLFSAPYAPTTRYEEAFFSLKTMERKINYKRLTAEPAPEGFISMCACTEPDKTGFGSVCVEYGRPKWPNTMLNHTHSEECFVFYFWHHMLLRPAMKRLFFPWETMKRKARFARAPHDYTGGRDPPSAHCGLQKILLETLNNVGQRTRCPQPLNSVRLMVSYIVQCLHK